MRQHPLRVGGLLGALTSLPLIAILYLGEQLAGLPFVPFDLFDWLARVLPGKIITFAIEAIVNLTLIIDLGSTSQTAKRIEQLLALGLAIAGGAVLGGVIAVIAVRQEKKQPAWRIGVLIGFFAFVITMLIELNLGMLKGDRFGVSLIWLATVIVSWSALQGKLLSTLTTPPPLEANPGARRAVLAIIGAGSAALALGMWGLGRRIKPAEQATGAGRRLTNLATAVPSPSVMPTPLIETDVTPTATLQPQPAVTSTPAPMATTPARIESAPGTRAELTANEDFYRVDINTRPVVIDEASWALQVDGLFNSPRLLTLFDLMEEFPTVTQTITMGCISNRIGGDLIGTSHWTGLRLRDLLEALQLLPEAKALFVEAADGFFESVVMADLMDPRTLLVYGMNGQTLPVEHGFPLRIYVPNRYGMKQPKWITRIEAIDHEVKGYWVKRGYSAEARPQTQSAIDTIATDHTTDGQIPIGGIAWAGDRGIQKVEIQVNDGEWVEAALRTPPLSPLTWVQWRYDWPSKRGTNSFRVRATDGTGALQIEEEQLLYPNGATGYHQKYIRI